MRTGQRLILTTTSSLDGWEITEYLGPVSSQFVIGTGLFADLFSTITDFFGRHSISYQKKLDQINQEAIDLITEKALKLGANAVLGLRVDHDEVSGEGKSMLMVNASGTAVKANPVSKKGKPEEGSAARTVTGYELRMLLERQKLSERAKAGKLNWNDGKLWRFVVDNQMGEVASYFIDYSDQLLGSDSGYSAPTEAEKQALVGKLEEFLSTLPAELAKPHLYECLSRHTALYDLAVRLIRQNDALDLEQLSSFIGGDNELARHRCLCLVEADQPTYSLDDIVRLERLLESIRVGFSKAEFYETKGLFGSKKVVWKCLCSKEADEESIRCSNCGRDQWGFLEGLVNPEQASRVLERKLKILRTQFST